jgi:hypothetical protein
MNLSAWLSIFVALGPGKSTVAFQRPCAGYSCLSPKRVVSHSNVPIFQTQTHLSVTPDALLVAMSEASSLDEQVFALGFLASPTFWSTAIMLSIIFLLYTWEESVRTAREKLGPTLMPVVDAMLAEMGGLGFIGLFLSVAVTGGPLGHTIGELSERFLGDEEILLETFEFLHTAFFEVGIGFFLIAGLTVAEVLKKIESLKVFSETIFDMDGNGQVSLEELAGALKIYSIEVDSNQDGILDEEEVQLAVRSAEKVTLWDEIRISAKTIQAEALVMRERFLRKGRVKPSFRIEAYCEKIFARNLKEIVELSPLVWLPLVPFLALGDSVDISRDVVSAASANAAESCGFFLGTPLFFAASSTFTFVSLIWGCFNFWKMWQIKVMLIPTLVRDCACSNQAVLLPPRYEDTKLLAEFNSSPSIFGWLEGFYAEPARSRHESLFGVAGAARPELYRNSIKFHSWDIVCQIVFYGTQTVLRDMEALWRGSKTGNPDLVVPELIVFGLYTALAIAQLRLAPTTFLNYSLITSVEQLTDEIALIESYATSEDDDVSRVNAQRLRTEELPRT